MDRLRFFTIRLILLTCLLTLTVGCGGATPPSGNTISVTVPTPLVICTLPTNTFYTATELYPALPEHSDSVMADKIYEEHKNARIANDEPGMARYRSWTLAYLAYQTKRWSQVVDKTVDNNNKVRLIVTFASPELIRAIILAHAIYSAHPETLPENFNFQQYTNERLAELDKRGELFFLVTIQPETLNQSNETISLSTEIFLENIVNDTARRTKIDNRLTDEFHFLDGQRAGLVFFSIGKSANDNCQPIIDIHKDTSVTLILKELKIGKNSEQIKIQIPLSPAIPLISAIPTIQPETNLEPFGFSPLTTILTPIPVATPLPGATSDEDMWYWVHLGRYVWAKLTFDDIKLR